MSVDWIDSLAAALIVALNSIAALQTYIGGRQWNGLAPSSEEGEDDDDLFPYLTFHFVGGNHDGAFERPSRLEHVRVQFDVRDKTTTSQSVTRAIVNVIDHFEVNNPSVTGWSFVGCLREGQPKLLDEDNGVKLCTVDLIFVLQPA